ncbi:hypothetical protein [Pseudohalioglobus lutimaris]|jgi:hypothetical protein|nr:hypothetical protein [Pseudohalioglobus lutimaris]
MHDSGDGIWDDGEWISWGWINQQLYQQELEAAYPAATLETVEVFEDLVDSAMRYHQTTGRYLQIWGELGELYAEIKYGLRRHAPGTKGSDGRLGDDWIEVKTISPEKTDNKVLVKRAGNFNKLLVVKIDEAFGFESRLIDRSALKGRKAKHMRFSWENSDGDAE